MGARPPPPAAVAARRAASFAAAVQSARVDQTTKARRPAQQTKRSTQTRHVHEPSQKTHLAALHARLELLKQQPLERVVDVKRAGHAHARHKALLDRVLDGADALEEGALLLFFFIVLKGG